MTADGGGDRNDGWPTPRGDPPRFDDPVARRGDVSPGTTAAIDAPTGREWTYADLDREVAATAGRLAGLGIRPGDHLGTLVGTRIAAVRLIHAAVRLGAVLVPLNPELPERAVAAQADRADVTALVCSADTEATAAAVAADSAGDGGGEREGIPVASVDEPTRGGTVCLADRDPIPGGFPRSVPRALDDPATVLFTSGTTGDPKAVALTAGNLLASAVGSAFRLGVVPGDRWLCELPAYHMGGIAPFVRTALYGTTAVVQPREDGFDPGRTLENLREYDATGVSLVPTQLRRLLDAGSLPDSLRFVLLGGGPAPGELIGRAVERDVPVFPTYGMTETASQVATATPGEAADDPGTVGRPLVTTTVTVVDDDGDPVDRGEVGEVVVDGPTVAPGYYDDPDATRAAFGEFGLHTGDLGRRDGAGRLWIRGRVDDLIRTGGETVDPVAVADALRGIDGVEDAAVVGVADPEWGERVAALVVPDDGAPVPPDAQWVRAAARERLAGHEAPKTVAFADELPRTASGTVDRGAVREAVRTDRER